MEAERRPLEESSWMFLAAAWNTARWIVPNDQHAQDLVQEAHIRAFRRGSALYIALFPQITKNAKLYFLR
jgi:DNA-directed RNA polymerase specialized sigma24 family protein